MSAEERIAELKKTLEYHIDRYYTKTIEYEDINYQLAQSEDQAVFVMLIRDIIRVKEI